MEVDLEKVVSATEVDDRCDKGHCLGDNRGLVHTAGAVPGRRGAVPERRHLAHLKWA